MSKFDKILLCSDLDGTLRNSKGEISKENIRAINYFKENGGLFTLCTGRNYRYAQELEREGLFVNTVFIALNGAVIYDRKSGKMLYGNPMNREKLGDIEKFTYENKSYLENITIHTEESFDSFEYLTEDRKLYKIVFTTKNTDATKIFKKKLKERYSDQDFFITTSWPTGIEILDRKSTKGECVKIIKNYIDTEIEKIVCVGDFENDITMLKEADISYAVENAIQPVKDAADYVTVSNDENALAKIISELEKNIC